MTYNDDGVYDTAYTYGIERVGIDILDNSRPDSQNPLYYLYDGLGSVSYITKPDGEIRDTYKYDEFGKPKTGKLSPDGDKILHTSFGYTGEQWDEESQLQYLRARYYDPEVGRFINRDTYDGEVENPLSKNLYAYVQNNPVNHKDPSGHRIDDQHHPNPIVPQVANKKITINGWLVLNTTPTSSSGRTVNIPGGTNKNHWYAFERLKRINFYARKKGTAVIGKFGQLTNAQGRYWVAVGPNVMNPNHKPSSKITLGEMKYGTKLDVKLKDSKGNYFYVYCVVGDVKAHTYPTGIVQTGKAFPNGVDYHPQNADHSVVEFIGKGSSDGLKAYQIVNIKVYN